LVFLDGRHELLCHGRVVVLSPHHLLCLKKYTKKIIFLIRYIIKWTEKTVVCTMRKQPGLLVNDCKQCHD
jgi:hypothetical protein